MCNHSRKAGAAVRAEPPALAAVSLVALAAFVLAGCPADPSAWYPKGRASLVSWYETEAGGVKSCVATIEIANMGSSTINSATISMAAATDLRTYRRTLRKEFPILPGCRAYFDAEIGYASATESLLSDGLSIVADYYL